MICWCPQVISLSGASFDRIAIFGTYHPHYKDKPGSTESAHNRFLPYYKDKLGNNPTQNFVSDANSIHFLYDFGNFSAVCLLGCNGGTYATEPGLVT